MLRFFVLVVCILTLTAPALVLAEEEEGADPAAGDEATLEETADEQAEDKDAAEGEEADKPLPPSEEKMAPLPPADRVALPPPVDKAADRAADQPGVTEVRMDESSPAKPPLNLLDLHGYFRLRGDLMNGLHLGLSDRLSGDEDPFTDGVQSRGAAYPQFPKSATGKEDTLAGANMRFRLEPTINISEDVRIMAQIDMLDNIILGSTPDGYPKSLYYPLVGFSQGQQPPMQGVNSIKDSILIRRVWGEVMTPLGLLRFGRMGSEWGLGLLANDGGPSHIDRGPLQTRRDPFSPMGHCFDCDYGSTADRIMFITKVFGHYIVPMIDFTSEGPYFTYVNEFSGQPFDYEQLDDVNSYILAIAKRDKPEDIEAALAQDDWVFNYGIYVVFRNQAYDAINYQTQTADQGRLQTVEDYAVRNMNAWIPDLWLRLMFGKLRIELEAVMIIGKIGYDAQSRSLDAEGNLMSELAGERISLLQYGGVLQADYRMLNDALLLGVEMGYASGDKSPGFGVRPFDEKQFEHSLGDNNINNFRFHPDYHVDMILWRQIIGTVTDAFYVKPTLQYDFAEGFGAKASVIYSQAVEKESTRGKSNPLGIEFDVDFFYFSDDNFHAGLSYGLLVPLSGMNDLGDGERRGVDPSAPYDVALQRDNDAELAHRVMGRLVLHF